MPIDPFAKGLMLTGALLILIGIGWQLGWIQQLRLGRLPGDILIERENMRLYFPLTTGLLISALLTLLSRLFRR